MRREKKFTFQQEYLSNVRKRIHDSKYLFRKTYDDRYVNSIYLDSFDFANYNENLSGLSQRSKARIRWYSEKTFRQLSENDDVSFEIKTRNNLFGEKLVYKLNFPIEVLRMNASEIFYFLRDSLPNEYLPHMDHCNVFSLGVAYKREYYEDFSKEIRATIDRNLSFRRLNNSLPLNFKSVECIKLEYGILELKYPQKIPDIMREIHFDGNEITPGRHSKYTIGVNLIES